ncbi:MAG TPA: hypothetical protein GX514_06870 [Thermoanaerobacterales bacterium]|nr:hypothetical protein [Thermoanaerobacterales bacterium]
MKPKNTTVSRLAFGEWRLPPADRSDGEVKKYYLSPEELEKYRKGGAQKVEKRRTVKQVLEEDFATGKKTIEQIAEELGIVPRIIKAHAAKLGFIEKKEKTEKTEIQSSSNIILEQAQFLGKFKYAFKDKKLIIRQDKRKSIVLSLGEIEGFKKDLTAVVKQIKVLNILSEEVATK